MNSLPLLKYASCNIGGCQEEVLAISSQRWGVDSVRDPAESSIGTSQHTDDSTTPRWSICSRKRDLDLGFFFGDAWKGNWGHRPTICSYHTFDAVVNSDGDSQAMNWNQNIPQNIELRVEISRRLKETLLGMQSVKSVPAWDRVGVDNCGGGKPEAQGL